MKFSITVVATALTVGTLFIFAPSQYAQAQNIAQSAPKRPVPQRATRPPAARTQSSANSYFESRTSTRSPQRRGMGNWRIGAHHQGMARELGRHSAPLVGRSAGSRAAGGSVTSSERIIQSSRSSQRRSTRRQTDRNRSRNGGAIDARLPWAARESAGVRFGAIPTPRPIPRTRPLGAPQVPYFAPGPATRLSQLPARNRLHRHRGRNWYAIEGRWFQRHRSNGYVSVIPPVGFVTPFLPEGVLEVFIDGIVYYRARGVSYREVAGEYLVVESVASSIASSGRRESDSLQPLFYSGLSDLYAEPIQGQNEQEFEADATRCIANAGAETKYKPTARTSDHQPPSASEQFNDFQAISRACLELAGYDIY